jgi:polyisoprenyl-phosphate glycosyltransferase
MPAREVPKLCLILPCYNEEAVLDKTNNILVPIVEKMITSHVIHEDSKICYINDGSGDSTWEIIKRLSEQHKIVKGIKLSTNFGHQNAILAGMLRNKDQFNCIISMDADLQDDVNVIKEMVLKFTEGYDVVYGVRSSRQSDSFFKKVTALIFYKLLLFMKVKSIYNHADFRLASRRVLDELENFKEVNLFLRGVFPLIGFKSTLVYYERKERLAGETKYPLSKMLAFAWNGITSFSSYPLKLISKLGFIIFFVSIGLTIWALLQTFRGITIPGWASLVIPIFVFSGLQMISIGLIGEYLGKIFQEIKSRPRYIIEEEI